MRVILTRPAGRAEPLASRLRELGHEVAECPLVAIEAIETGPVQLDGYDWLILTSATGAHELKSRAEGRPAKVAAIGRATAEAWGDPVDLVPRVSTQEGLLAELPRSAGRVLFAGAANARPLLAAELGCDVVHLYRTVELRPNRFPEGDVVILASGSAARAFAALGVPIPAVSIGPATTAEARSHGVEVAAEAPSQDAEGLLAALARLGPWSSPS